MLDVRLATDKDYNEICELYNDLLDFMGPNNPQRWTKGVYPSNEFVESTINKKTMYIGILENEIVAAMVLDHHFTKGYETVDWDIDATDDDVISIHALCVKPKYARRGFATEMIKNAVVITRELGSKAMRLDVIDGHDGANKLYQSAGFVCKGEHKLVYESTDCTKFTMYEYIV